MYLSLFYGESSLREVSWWMEVGVRRGFEKLPILASLTDKIKVCLYSQYIHIHHPSHTSVIITISQYHDYSRLCQSSIIQYIEHVMSRNLSLLLLCLLVLSQVHSYDKIDGYNQLMAYHQDNSQYVIIHVYYNNHFSKSRQFEDFLEVLEETEYRNQDYTKFVLTDCQNFKEGETYACDEMKITKDNRMVFGYYPADQFVNYGGKKMQNPPKNRQFNHPRDVYTVAEFQAFIDEMIPNFYEEVESIEEYKEWLKPKYSPKLIFASRQDEIPLALKKIGVHFFLRYDLAYVSDLTESVVKQLNITTFPKLMVIKSNFRTSNYDAIIYEGTDFSSKSYQKIKDFLEPNALKQPRNDILFHKMKMLPDQGIVTSDDSVEVEEFLNRANGWVLVSAVKGDPVKLKMLKEMYGRFFQYIHYMSGNQTQQLQVYDPEKELMFDMPDDQLHFKSLPRDEFLQTMTAWIKKNFVIIGVRERYAHMCSIALSKFFRGLTQCLIIKEESYEQLSNALKMEFQVGFACYQTNEKTENKFVGRNFKRDNYEDIYLSIEYVTRLKSKEIVDQFMDKPIKEIAGTDKIAEICAFPYKKCALLFTHSSRSDRTAYDYLKDIAINFINEYQFYEIDLDCNSEFQEEIENLKKQGGGLVVYHHKKASYVTLKAKLSKSTFQKFLKANLIDSKKLPFHSFKNPNIEVHKCSMANQAKQVDREEQESL